ncbi:MAG: response regulator [Calditrichaeota bacterium]|nr:response regulator [Calditrichota bacterium]
MVIDSTQSEKEVLIVDDDPRICAILEQFIGELGYRTHSAADSNELINYYDTQTPYIVFLDYHLPGVDGLKLLRLIKRLTPEVTVVMISGEASEDIARTTLRVGAFDYITKPFTHERVSEIIRAIELT